MVFLAAALLAAGASATCSSKQILRFNSQNEAECIDCPANCSICYMGLREAPVCAFCDDGFFLKDKQCQACSENCAHCIGPSLSMCRNPKNGFFFDASAKAIRKCTAEGCGTCHSADKCSSCQEGFYAAERKTEDGQESVTCKPCGIENCIYCVRATDQIKNQQYVTCNLCKSGYGLISGKCEKCSPNCQFCHEESRECTFCENGFYLSKPDNSCRKIPIDHCFSLSETGECNYCESHFYFDGKACQSCRTKEPNCNYCTTKEENFTCLSCIMGYYKTNEDKCVACGPNCNHCDTNRCLVCENGFFIGAEGKCEKCGIANCDFCKTSEVCESCTQGFFFDEKSKSCVKCKGNCLRCSPNGENCLSCPIDHFSLQEEIISEKKGDNFVSTLLSLFIGFAPAGPKVSVTEIKIVTKCVKSCPASIKGHPVTISPAERKCLVKFDGKSGTTDFGNKIEKNDLMKSLMSLRVEYDAQVAHFKKVAFESAQPGKSGECNFRGVLKKEIRGNLDSYYICRCDDGYLGDNCQIPLDLYEKVQNQLVEILNEIQNQFIGLNHRKKSLFLHLLVLINKFKIGYPIVEKMVSLVRSFLEKDKELDNKKKLYILYDGFLLNLFDQLEDIRKLPASRANSDTDLFTTKANIFAIIKTVLGMIESSLEDHVYTNSFLERNSSNYIALDTFSYIVSENQLASYVPDKGFVSQNPNIDTSFNMRENNYLYLDFEPGFDHKSHPLNFQILTFSAMLFQNEIKSFDEVLVSNVLYLKYIDPKSPHKAVTTKESKVKRLIVVFALLFVPSYEDVVNNVSCIAYDFSRRKDSIGGKAIEFDEVAQTLKCEFYTYFDFRNFYFAVSAKKV